MWVILLLFLSACSERHGPLADIEYDDQTQRPSHKTSSLYKPKNSGHKKIKRSKAQAKKRVQEDEQVGIDSFEHAMDERNLDSFPQHDEFSSHHFQEREQGRQQEFQSLNDDLEKDNFEKNIPKKDRYFESSPGYQAMHAQTASSSDESEMPFVKPEQESQVAYNPYLKQEHPSEHQNFNSQQSTNRGRSEGEGTQSTRNMQLVPLKDLNKLETTSKEKGFVWPVKGRVVKRFGEKSNTSEKIDFIAIKADPNAKVRATFSGIIQDSGPLLEGMGQMIIIKHPNKKLSIYMNLKKVLVSKGKRVESGDVIAETGTSPIRLSIRSKSSASKGKWLPVDPLLYLK
jgi:murein DD-endopeptidase MepM/ murein hydrolase activator NlpD